MEEQNIIALWKEQSVKIDRSLAVNRKLLRELVNQKAHSSLRSLSWLLSGSILAGILYLLLLGALLALAVRHYSHAADYFIVSFGAIWLFNIKALSDYVRHIVCLNKIDYDDTVLNIRQKLTRLQLSMIRNIRVMFLQLPFWTTFYLSGKWFPVHTPWYWILFQVAITGASVYAAYWIYRNLSLENVDKKIIRMLLNSWDRKYVLKASAFYKDAEDFEE
ncbi:MAG: hypothetical protein PW786_06085 [Arachidicoccus sp.]|nr:hypothetical protein [Arachidicoccus sp.]